MKCKNLTYSELKKNKHLLLEWKKNRIKEGDPFSSSFSFPKKGDKNKEIDSEIGLENEDSEDEITRDLVINAMNFIDYDKDVILTNAFKKSVSENRSFYLLNAHKMSFENIIASSRNGEITASLEEIDINKLNYSGGGKTQVLLFSTKIKKKVNEFMFNNYKENRVHEHSVGMRYVKIFLCVNPENDDFANDPDFSNDIENWKKYYDLIINKEDVGEYFWAITEAKFIEGSAVPLGANKFTPALIGGSEEKNKRQNPTNQKKVSSFVLDDIM